MLSVKMRYPVIGLLIGNAVLLSACGDKAATPASSSATPSASAAAEAAASPKAATATAAAAANDSMKQTIEEYRKYVVDEMGALVKDTEAFVQAVKSGDIATAQKLYATTRMHYERIEPIAESLGDFDPWIDARENDVPDAEWRGFHKLEKALWVEKTTAGYEATADQLLNDVHLLRVKVESVEIEPTLLTTGAVELLNEVSSSKVTGEEERYSHTDLYDFAANVEGSEKIFKLLQADLSKKDAALAKTIEEKFADLNSALSQYRQSDNGYKAYTDLTPEDTKTLSRKLDALAEPLSHLGKVLEG